jgi:hypothetical protein
MLRRAQDYAGLKGNNVGNSQYPLQDGDQSLIFFQ